MAAMLVVAVFFEGAGYSFQAMGVRVRSVQVLEIVFLGFLGVLWLLGKWRWQKSPLDFWLLAYLSINFIAIFNSQWKARSVKIFLLFVSLAILYWLVYQLLRTAKDIFLAFYVFLAMGTLQVLFGLYQVLAGALNHYRGWRLPIGYAGIVQREFINSVWGRPYGTQVEPDFYGAICMVFALIFIILYFSKSGISKRWLLAGMFVSMLGLYLSFVRTSWLVFLLVLPILPFFKKKLSFFRFTWKSAVFIISVAVGAHVIAVNTVPPIKQIIQSRFGTKVLAKIEEKVLAKIEEKVPAKIEEKVPAKIEEKVPAKIEEGTAHQDLPAVRQDSSSLLNKQNVRFRMIKISLWAWRENPVFGNGPGSFAYANWRYSYGDAGARQKIAEKASPRTNPSILFTVLEETGLLGLIVFMVIAGKILFLSFNKLTVPPTPLTPQTFALFVGLVALFLFYMLTDGLWLPLSWVFLGLNIASLKRFPEVSDGDSMQTHAEGNHAHRL